MALRPPSGTPDAVGEGASKRRFPGHKNGAPRSFQKVAVLGASNEPIDWPLLAQRLAARGYEGHGSTQAMAVLELMIGEEAIRQAVDYYVAWKPEAELARNVLWRLRPWSAMQRCDEIYHSSADIAQCRAATDLLRVVADERAPDWIDKFLADQDDGV